MYSNKSSSGKANYGESDFRTNLFRFFGQNFELFSRFILSQKLQFPVLPFFGACGRVSLIQGPHKPLQTYLQESLAVRIDLGKESGTCDALVIRRFTLPEVMPLSNTDDSGFHVRCIELCKNSNGSNKIGNDNFYELY